MTSFGGVCVALTRRRVPEQPNILLWFFKFKKKKQKKTQAKGNAFPRRAKHPEQFWCRSSPFWWGGAQKSRETLTLVSRDVNFTAEFRAVH
jgi:hypothetical protein